MAEHVEIVAIPRVPHGPEGIDPRKADADYYREAARNIRFQFPKSRFAGSNLTEAVARLCEAAAKALDRPPFQTFAGPESLPAESRGSETP